MYLKNTQFFSSQFALKLSLIKKTRVSFSRAAGRKQSLNSNGKTYLLWQMLAKFLNIIFSRTVIDEKLNFHMFENILPYTEMHIGFFLLFTKYIQRSTHLFMHM